ncbi:MAG: flagellar motor protein MotB, partial [Sphingomonadales bacterium]|nr:flagellar motor protein MotB [Sphingomonadales bacterium]
MRKLLFATAASMAFAIPAAPAMAADGAPYVGIEGGLMKARPSDWDRRTSAGYFDYLDVHHKLGYDVDGIVGYDFGLFRVEGEVGYKRAKHRDYVIDSRAPGPFPGGIVR